MHSSALDSSATPKHSVTTPRLYCQSLSLSMSVICHTHAHTHPCAHMHRQTPKVSLWPNVVYFLSLPFPVVWCVSSSVCSMAGSLVGSFYLSSALPLSSAQPWLILSLLIQVAPQVVPFFFSQTNTRFCFFLSTSAHFIRSNRTMLSARERTSESVLTVEC